MLKILSLWHKRKFMQDQWFSSHLWRSAPSHSIWIYVQRVWVTTVQQLNQTWHLTTLEWKYNCAFITRIIINTMRIQNFIEVQGEKTDVSIPDERRLTVGASPTINNVSAGNEGRVYKGLEGNCEAFLKEYFYSKQQLMVDVVPDLDPKSYFWLTVFVCSILSFYHGCDLMVGVFLETFIFGARV